MTRYHGKQYYSTEEYIAAQAAWWARYRAHLASEWWRNFRAAVIRERGYKCERCGSRGPVDVHHKHYRNMGNEWPEDVKLLCWPCHQLQHPKRKLR